MVIQEKYSHNLRVGTFNAWNLALPDTNYGHGQIYTQERYEKKTKWIGEQLDEMACHLVGFQEVFQVGALNHAVNKTKHLPQNTKVYMGEGARDRSNRTPRCGLVTSLHVRDFEEIVDFPPNARINFGASKIPVKTFLHPVFRARVELPSGHLAQVFVAHLKSKRPEWRSQDDQENPAHEAVARARSLVRRAAEAVALRCIMLEHLHENITPVILLGDLNASVTASTSEILAGDRPWQFKAERSRNKRYKDEISRQMDVLLYSVKDVMALRTYQDVYYTHIFNGYFQALDHIYVSEEFVEDNKQHIGIVHNVRVFNDHLVDFALLGDSVDEWMSDHGQVVADLRLRM